MKIYVKGHDCPDVDSIVSGYLFANILNRLGYDAEFIIWPTKIDEDTLNLCQKYGIDVTKYMSKYPVPGSYVLVDHYDDERIHDIVGIIDHHYPLKKISKESYWYEEASATSCMLGIKYESILTRDEIILAALGGVADTSSFHSVKTRASDVTWVRQMADKYHFSYPELLQDGLCLTPLTQVENLAFHGLKKYIIDDEAVEASYIQIKASDFNNPLIRETFHYIDKYVKEQNLRLFLFIIHDMTNFKSYVYKIAKERFSCEIYPEYSSRGNVIIPKIHFK